MKFTLTLAIDNAAFAVTGREDLAEGGAVAYMLKQVLDDVGPQYLGVGDAGRIRDPNGNMVGTWTVKDE